MSKLSFVGAGPGDPELLTIKGRRLLDEADVVIYAGSLVNPELLVGLRAAVYDSASMELQQIVRLIRTSIEQGKRVVRLHTGDISFYSAITEQIKLLEAVGIHGEVVPGVSSVGAGAAALGQELTIPEVSQTVILTRMAGRTPVPELESIASLAAHQASMVIFLSAGMIAKLCEELSSKGSYPADTPVAIVERASWPQQRIVRGTLSDIAQKAAEAAITRTALVYVGAALAATAGMDTPQSKLYDSEFKHGYRQ